jgi:hypothetical protein
MPDMQVVGSQYGVEPALTTDIFPDDDVSIVFIFRIDDIANTSAQYIFYANITDELKPLIN